MSYLDYHSCTLGLRLAHRKFYVHIAPFSYQHAIVVASVGLDPRGRYFFCRGYKHALPAARFADTMLTEQVLSGFQARFGLDDSLCIACCVSSNKRVFTRLPYPSAGPGLCDMVRRLL